MATVTMSELYYEGSLTVDEELMERADILAGEKVSVVNLNNGERFETYVITGKRGAREICLNGPAARKGYKGDKIIIITYCTLDEKEIARHRPKVLIADENNNVDEIKSK